MLVLIAFPVSFFYFLFCSRARKTCEDYQRHLISFAKNQGSNFLRKVNTYKQILSFSICLIEKIEGWCGKEKLSDICFYDDDVVELKKILAEGKGAFLIGSHLGNIELLRSLASFGKTGVYFIFAMRKKDISFRKKYDMLVIKSAVTFSGSRLERKQSQETMCSEFVSLLEKECLKHPFQWYNFYYYWNNVGDTSGR